MENNIFEEPVSIIIGLGYPAELESVDEAYAVLSEWPQRQRDAAYRVALQACKAALDGAVDAETARSAFAAFARRAGILAPENDVVVAAQAAGHFHSAVPA